jgi:hypothetical protein
MTNKDRLISFLGFAPPNESIDGELIDAGIDGSDDYDISLKDGLKLMAIRILQLILTTADVSDGNAAAGFVHSIKFDRVAVLARIKLLENELGIDAGTLPTIRGLQIW